MINKKYVLDYKVEPYLDAKGRIKNTVTYIGKYYRFERSKEERKSKEIILAVLSGIMWVLFILPMVFDSALGRKVYVIMPYALHFIPLLFLCTAVIDVFTVKEPMTRERKDKIQTRIAGAGIACMILGALSALTALIALISSEAIGIYDIVFSASIVLNIICSVGVFTLRRYFAALEANESTDKQIR